MDPNYLKQKSDDNRRHSSPPRPPQTHSCNNPSPGIIESINSSPRRHTISTPTRSSPAIGDRYIPSRLSTRLDNAFDLLEQDDKSRNSFTGESTSLSSSSARENQGLLNSLIRSELLGTRILQTSERFECDNSTTESPKSTPGKSLLRYSSERNSNSDEMLSPNSLLLSPNNRRTSPGSAKKSSRKINRQPFKVLDAPSLQDDFYLNLVDWSSTNLLSVGLGQCVYLWSASTAKVTKLFDFGEPVTSVTWSPIGSHLAVGTNSGKVLLWDAVRCQQIQELGHHASRVGSLAWNTELLASGSRDKNVFLHDARIRSFNPSGGASTLAPSGGASPLYSPLPTPPGWPAGRGEDTSPCVVQKLTAHKQEVCGLRWSPDEKQLASGGNDNKLFIWEMQNGGTDPLFQFTDHIAAVKAIAWSPHQHGLLVSGGGTADRHIRFWNTVNGMPLHRVDTGSQVCNLMWSRNVNEIVSTHGYSLNQVIVWKYPAMSKVATLTGHTLRVLYLAMSPDGESVVTGAGDETLRFWNLFPEASSRGGSWTGGSVLFPTASDIR